MPANSGYDRVPLLDHLTQEEFEKEKDKFWEHLDSQRIDGNANRIYDENMKNTTFSNHKSLPESRIQLFPEPISSSSSSHNPASSSSLASSSSSSSAASNTTKKFPKERRKAILAFFLMAFGFICNSISIVLTHQKVPDRTLHPPLPDMSLDNFTKRRWLNDLADILVIWCTISSTCLIVMHRHRWILCRRMFIILGILYGLRSITMYATVLPLANDHVVCGPKMNASTVGQTVYFVTTEVLKLIGAGGMNIAGKKTLCGDYIFSGHSIILLSAYLLINEYVPKKLSVLHWSSWIVAWVGMICLLVSHGHYTIDVLIAYFATTRLFWMYHTFSNNVELQRRSSSNSLSEVWWFPIFQYFEGSVKGKIPKEFEMPRIRGRVRGQNIIMTNRNKEFLE